MNAMQEIERGCETDCVREIGCERERERVREREREGTRERERERETGMICVVRMERETAHFLLVASSNQPRPVWSLFTNHHH